MEIHVNSKCNLRGIFDYKRSTPCEVCYTSIEAMKSNKISKYYFTPSKLGPNNISNNRENKFEQTCHTIKKTCENCLV